MSEIHVTIARWLRESTRAVAFTGAGTSTESGIPDFRSPGGVWTRTQPVYYDDFLRSAAARLEYWRQKSEVHQDFVNARPNVAHELLSRWESTGQLRGVITQNIDGMHQLAGSQNVLELHGTAREVGCLQCPARFDAEPLVEEFLETDQVPVCPKCGGHLKHATISFGQQLDSEVIEESARWSREADFYLAMGSSLVVHPAAGLPQLAKENGARLVIINRESTPLDEIADVAVHGALGETLAAVDTLLQQSS